jgi:peroxiredoxin Q/BCP
MKQENTHIRGYKDKISSFLLSKASTPGCTAEACDLRDNFNRFQANNYALLGIALIRQKPNSNSKKKYELPFHY